jgi:hypothetical protein
MILFRQNRPGYPFLWEDDTQPAARWHAEGEGPAHYLADTPDGAWAEFLRHQEIREEEDLKGIQRDLWAIEIPDDESFENSTLPYSTTTGGKNSYAACQKEAQRLRTAGATGIKAPSASILPGDAGGFRVESGLKPASRRDGNTYVLYGRRPDFRGWKTTSGGHPSAEVLKKVRYF